MGGLMGGGKGGGGGGGGPDPVQTAQAQAALNRQAALDSARINQISQYTPWAGSYWTGEIGSPDRAQHTVYNPALAGMIFGGPGGGGGLVGQLQGAYSSPLDFSGFQSISPMGGQEWGGAAPISAPQQSYHPHFSTGGAYMPGGFGGAQGGGGGGAPGMQDPFFGQGSMAARAARGEDPYGGGGGDGGHDYGGDFSYDGADYLGAGGFMDLVDGITGGALSGFHDAGVDDFGGLSASAQGTADGWGTGSYGNVGSSYSGDGLDGDYGGVGDGSGSGSTGGGFDSTGADYGDYGDFDDGGGFGDDDGGFDGGLGYQMGGFTGLGDDGVLQPDKPAGTVHEGEMVIPAHALIAMLSQGGGKKKQPAPMTTVPGQGGGQPGLASLLAGGM